MIVCIIDDKRSCGEAIKVSFTGVLRAEQERALRAMLCFDCGVLQP